MEIIGKIDINIYKCITSDIQSDKVIITDKQIEHIKENHPTDYENYADAVFGGKAAKNKNRAEPCSASILRLLSRFRGKP